MSIRQVKGAQKINLKTQLLKDKIARAFADSMCDRLLRKMWHFT